MGTSYSDISSQEPSIITNDNYNRLPLHRYVSPPRLTFSILRKKIEGGNIFNISATSSLDPSINIKFSLTQMLKGNFYTITHISNNPGITIIYEKGNTTNLDFSVVIENGSVFIPTGAVDSNKHAINEDMYTFLYNGLVKFIPNQLKFYRNEVLNLSNPNTLSTISKINTLILINSQTLIDGSDIGNTVFKITNNNTKIYEKNCILIASVLKGEGKTAAEKVENIYLTNDLPVNFYDFGYNMIKYSILRYILSKLLYDNFDINYLLRSYYEDFLKDLKYSQYSNYLNYFIGYNAEFKEYYKYFLYNLD